MELVIVNNGIPTTTTIAIAEGTGNEHKAVIQLVRNYLSDLEQFGRVAFEMAPFETAGGTQSREIASLNERQATLIMSYMKNTAVIRKFKTQLVKSFYELAEQKPSLPTDPIIAQLQIMMSMRQDVVALSNQIPVLSTGIAETRHELQQLKEDRRLENWQQQAIQKAVNHKVDLWKELYPSLNVKKAFVGIWRHLKEKFQVPRYNEIPAIKYEQALTAVNKLNMQNLAGL